MPYSNDRLKMKISQLVKVFRKPIEKTITEEPRYISYDRIIQPDGKVLNRKKVILMSNGCSVPTCTMCPFTNENMFGLTSKVAENNFLKQVQHIFYSDINPRQYDVLAIYNDGSFFSEVEMPQKVILKIAEEVTKSKAKRLVVESLPQFINEDKIKSFTDILGKNTKLEVGMGLQSANEFIRNVCINTNFTNDRFERAVEVLRKYEVDVKSYILIKPPFLDEREAFIDAIDTIDYLVNLRLFSITLCPTRVAKNTLAYELYLKGFYSPPNLWTIVDILKLKYESAKLRVACINLRGDDFDSIMPRACDLCSSSLIRSLERFSTNQNINDLPNNCQCHNNRAYFDSGEIDYEHLHSKIEYQINALYKDNPTNKFSGPKGPGR
ncbi:TIGR01210 family radical SAM protein [Desulfosarcina ovata subsp. sediminis]|uniref:TIGR01210 family radical SAM protein n=1 Tax=Desulfosarcina ovata subsp. sediminis TaxID=885957 RepID=A0A5K8A0S1_9BACT|nr:hypothetical protein [Desulfosarcina ovata]BBO86132.1 TIGR01210 family radical SAM protein [Desulfosarcina ovata subsp. sediminis]